MTKKITPKVLELTTGDKISIDEEFLFIFDKYPLNEWKVLTSVKSSKIKYVTLWKGVRLYLHRLIAEQILIKKGIDPRLLGIVKFKKDGPLNLTKDNLSINLINIKRRLPVPTSKRLDSVIPPVEEVKPDMLITNKFIKLKATVFKLFQAKIDRSFPKRMIPQLTVFHGEDNKYYSYRGNMVGAKEVNVRRGDDVLLTGRITGTKIIKLLRKGEILQRVVDLTDFENLTEKELIKNIKTHNEDFTSPPTPVITTSSSSTNEIVDLIQKLKKDNQKATIIILE